MAHSPRFVSQLTKHTLALILAGGRGSRLQHLTQWRAKPAVPFGGQFRIIDFPLSNCVNSGIRQIGILTQYKAHSLIRHVQCGWPILNGEFSEFIELLPAQQRLEGGWYLGTADAVYQNLDILRGHNPSHVLILAGDHIYKMDYGPMLAQHVAHQAELTVGCIEVPRSEAHAFGIISIDDQHRIVSFTEKPDHPAPLPDNPEKSLVSMGIYVFNTEFLIQHLIEDADRPGSSHDFGKDVIPRLIDHDPIYAYPFRDHGSHQQAYWRDVGTVDAYWKANQELIGVTPELNLYDKEWPIRTFTIQTPPAKFVFDDPHRRGMAVDSMVSSGCIVSGAFIKHSLLFNDVTVNEGSVVKDAVVLPEVNIGRNCRVTRAIIEKRTRLPDNTVIGNDPLEDAKRFYVSPQGVVLVVPEMLGQRTHHAR
ncbi:glucose-1-phosphate adenylyltransferase [Aestuariicella hydrocarbonica]|uniref:Glucose-1-phosphate adenylyltransferase n=2 Tax=Pseudomaricurvus hydrocarbonicus TaxID=1470433 RepID=A0A9E5MKC0_9GAMM|nr:glucose-1-phosphate adenylyltransferase [Aestuariicella hydrocarbonica]